MKYINFICIVIFSSTIISCTTTNVKVSTEPKYGYETYYNGKFVGRTPCEIEASNLFWKKHEVTFTKDGTIVNKVKLQKEMKWVNCLVWGWFYGIGLLWVKGPMENQTFYIDPESKFQYTSKTKLYRPPEKYTGKKSMVAVMDFQAKGVSRYIARNVSELIRGELINTRRYTVIERAQMGKILREQGFQQTGCTDISCAVKVGRILSARKILIGTVMKMGKRIIITGRIVDVEKGIGEQAANHGVNSIDELDKGVYIFIGKLAGLR